MDIFAFPGAPALRMAGETEFPALLLQETRVLRGVGSVAGEATLSARNGSMAHCGPGRFVSMAREAEFVAILDQQLLIRRGMRIMAGKAHAVLERRVFKAPACLEGRRVMAHGAETPSSLRSIKGFL